MADVIEAQNLRVVARDEASVLGERAYYTGRPCKRGHIAQRYVSSRECIECYKSRIQGWRKNNKPRVIESRRAWDKANPEKRRISDAKSYLKCRDARQAQSRVYRLANAERVKERKARRYISDRVRICAKLAEYRAKNPEKVKAIKARWYQNNKESLRIKAANWYALNRTACLAGNKTYREANADRLRVWRQENRDKDRINQHNRRARIKGSVGSHTLAEIQNLFRQQSGRCAYCKRSISRGYHKDHYVPLVLGGANDIKNIRLTCAPCNLRKHTKLPEVFARHLGLLVI